MRRVVVTKTDEGLGFVLPKDIAETLGARDGGYLLLTPSAHGFELSAPDPEFENQIRIGEGIMDRYRETPRKLAKD